MELTLLQSRNVTVTSTRFVVGTQTYAIRDIDSAEFYESAPIRWIPGVLFLLGIIPVVGRFAVPAMWAEFIGKIKIGLTPDQHMWMGSVLASVAMVWLAVQSAQYAIVLHFPHRTERALKSPNRKFVTSVLAALNQAIRAEG